MLDNLKSLFGEEAEETLSFKNKAKESAIARQNQVLKLLKEPIADLSSSDSSDSGDRKESKKKRRKVRKIEISSSGDDESIDEL